jgi:hypothetical protein
MSQYPLDLLNPKLDLYIMLILLNVLYNAFFCTYDILFSQRTALTAFTVLTRTHPYLLALTRTYSHPQNDSRGSRSGMQGVERQTLPHHAPRCPPSPAQRNERYSIQDNRCVLRCVILYVVCCIDVVI